MKTIVVALGIVVGAVLATFPSEARAAYAVIDGVTVQGCSGTTIVTDYGYTYCVQSSAGSYGYTGGYILETESIDDYEAGWGGSGYRRSVGTFHCDYCTVGEDPIGSPPNPEIQHFITTFVNTMVETWQKSATTYKNVTICNGPCATYQYVAGGTWYRSR